MNAFTGVGKNTTNILRNMTGRLFKSFNPQTALEPNDTDVDVSLANNRLLIKIGSNVPYAAIHNYGGTIENGFGRGIKIVIPKRDYFDKAVGKFETKNKIQMKDYLEQKFILAVRSFTYQGEMGLLRQFVRELHLLKTDLLITAPLKFQKHIGTSMKLQAVSKSYKGAG